MDFDRTFTMVEGLATFPIMQHFITKLRLRCSVDELIEFYMGGKPRLEAMKLLLNKIEEKNIKLIILTNNTAVSLITDFIANLHIYNTSDNLFELISTHYYGKDLSSIQGSFSGKNKILKHKNICNETKMSDVNILASELQTNGFDIHNILKINTKSSSGSPASMPGGANKRHNKKTKKRT